VNSGGMGTPNFRPAPHQLRAAIWRYRDGRHSSTADGAGRVLREPSDYLGAWLVVDLDGGQIFKAQIRIRAGGDAHVVEVRSASPTRRRSPGAHPGIVTGTGPSRE